MPNDSIKITRIRDLMPQLYQNTPKERTQFEKNILEHRTEQQFLSPQERALRYLMKMGGIEAANLPEIPDVSPQGIFNNLVEKRAAEVREKLAAEQQIKQPQSEETINRQPQSIPESPQLKPYSPDQELQDSLNAINRLHGVK